MSVRSFFTDLFSAWGAGASSDPDPGPSVNPATGLPMVGRAVDVAGNPFGVNLHRDDHQTGVSSSLSGIDDHHHSSSHDHWSGSAGSIGTGWDSSSTSGTSSPWPDHTSSSGGGYDPSRGW